jgi:hypothetical protein
MKDKFEMADEDFYVIEIIMNAVRLLFKNL